ncbi:MAG: hypothetical protein RLY86_3948 [Pseudomonadota bacterium]|jgi:starvation-inducible outer membrane lipoprotein
MSRRSLALAALLPLLLAACMAPPAERERQGQIDPAKACRLACERSADVCSGQRSAQSSGGISAPTEYGMTAVCNTEFRQCLVRCGGGG